MCLDDLESYLDALRYLNAFNDRQVGRPRKLSVAVRTKVCSLGVFSMIYEARPWQM